LIRLGRAAEATDVLRATIADGHMLAGERFALLASAFTRLGRFDESADALTSARAFAYGSSSVALEAEVEYFGGLAAFAAGDLATLEATSVRILTFEDRAASYGATPVYPVPLAHTRARAYEALGAVALSRNDYRGQATFSRRAIRELDEADVSDAWIAATNVMNLAVLSGTHDLFEHVEFLRDRLASIPWTDELSSRRFTALDAFGWHLALRGDNVGAFRQFRLAAAVARTIPERVLASVSRAHLSHELGHAPIAREEIEHGIELAEQLSGKNGGSDQRVALVQLAEAAAKIAPAAARNILEQYRATRGGSLMLSLSGVEPWLRASEGIAVGLIARAEGDRTHAVEALTGAHATLTKAGLEWRAAAVAIELAELGAGETYLREARREAVRRPASWIARRAATLER
jgi:tetratricopeptide (TPR) repeat protein